MDPRTHERVERWDSRPYEGREDLLGLADREFSGAITAGGGWAFMLNGRVVGVFDGTIETIRSTATGTVYDAPDPALPLLCSMEARGGETRAKYYTNETPIAEVDRKLQSASFTGYLELSEQVLSGDYYLVYYGGRRMAAAYIGASERLITDDEAFERADDEVGIYRVVDVDVDVTDVVEDASATSAASDTATTATGSAAGAAGSMDEPDESPTESTDSVGTTGDSGAESADSVGETTPDADETTTAVDDPTPVDTAESTADAAQASSAPPADAESAADPDPESSARVSDDAAAAAEDRPSAGITTTDDPDPEPETQGITDASAATGEDESTVETPAEGGDRSAPDDARSATDATTSQADARADSTADERDATADAEAPDPDTVTDPATDPGPAADPDPATDPDDATAAPEEPESEPDERFEEEARWRETRSIPSIDPEASIDPEGAMGNAASDDGWPTPDAPAEAAGAESAEAAPDQKSEAARQPRPSRRADSSHQSSPSRQSTPSRQSDDDRSAEAERDPADVADAGEGALTPDMLEREDKIDRLTQRVTELEAERDELRAERDELRTDNEELSGRVQQLEARIRELESELDAARAGTGGGPGVGGGAASGMQLSPSEALTGTNLFVRYQSKSQPTLDTAHDGGADREEVASNLRLERHTQFDADDATVLGESYESFLESSMEYRFVEWLVTTLPYEIRDTGRADGLADVYDVLPRIDRAELSATIRLDDEDPDVPAEVTFDVVAFDKMGTPLVAANLNDSREPATQEMLVELEESASAVNATYPDLGGAFVVTSSFFEPGALEVADEATSGGFLSRGSKLSYVNLSRKHGYHLCLVESRSAGFHVTVPDL